ncbi:hypothetical protein [Streptomyces sp. NPDC097619]|uniref:hypothetical protein n=1 Tax=Streptomyces sp. NPDC097619 TaxID=3157228 RepID=UPI00331FDBBB
MTAQAVTQIVRRVASADDPVSVEGLSEIFSQEGWVTNGSTTLPFPRRWSFERTTAAIFTDPNSAFIQFAFHVIEPDTPDYESAMEDEYAAEIQDYQSLEQASISLLGGLDISHDPERLDDSISFISGTCWKINHTFLSIGVSHEDEDLPIVILARLRQQ